MTSPPFRITAEQIAAAQLRIVLDEKLGRHTPNVVRRIAMMTGAHSAEEKLTAPQEPTHEESASIEPQKQQDSEVPAQVAHVERAEQPPIELSTGARSVLGAAKSPQVPADPPVSGSRVRQLWVNKENLAPRPSRLRYPLARRHARELERMRQEGEQRLVGRVHDIIVELGLTQADYSRGGGRTLHIPEVISVTERPVGFDIRMLPGQIPDDFAAHAQRIAYNLDVAEIRVVPLGPSLIRLILLP